MAGLRPISGGSPQCSASVKLRDGVGDGVVSKEQAPCDRRGMGDWYGGLHGVQHDANALSAYDKIGALAGLRTGAYAGMFSGFRGGGVVGRGKQFAGGGE